MTTLVTPRTRSKSMSWAERPPLKVAAAHDSQSFPTHDRRHGPAHPPELKPACPGARDHRGRHSHRGMSRPFAADQWAPHSGHHRRERFHARHRPTTGRCRTDRDSERPVPVGLSAALFQSTRHRTRPSSFHRRRRSETTSPKPPTQPLRQVQAKVGRGCRTGERVAPLRSLAVTAAAVPALGRHSGRCASSG